MEVGDRFRLGDGRTSTWETARTKAPLMRAISTYRQFVVLAFLLLRGRPQLLLLL